MMKSLVGYTGFVGSNIAARHNFDGLYNSRNIASAFGTKPDLLVYSGVPSEMFLANTNPAADLSVTETAAENIRKIAPKQLVLISTIAVLDNVNGTDEDSSVGTDKLTTYGLHRYKLEQLAREIVPNCHVLRLPALFGAGMKKNFIYDLINFFPAMLSKAKLEEFSVKEPLIADCYIPQENGFYKLSVTDGQKLELKAAFERLNFSALNFTDSRSVFQFYNVSRLWEHIEIAMRENIPLLHLATDPISASDVYRKVVGGEFVNELPKEPFNYDFRTKYANLFDGKGGYILSRERVLSDLTAFVRQHSL
jgi:nucleoside-diphosphate-sugar epimerase